MLIEECCLNCSLCCPYESGVIREPCLEDLCHPEGSKQPFVRMYDKLLARKRETASNILEIGVFYGGSLCMWQSYFPKAMIYGIDVVVLNPALNCEPRIRVVLEDAYTARAIEFINDRVYDVIIDDGPHSLESMIYVAANYSKLLAPDGILVMERIQSLEWSRAIVESLPAELRRHAFMIDRREETGGYDHICLVIDRMHNL